ncbi:hypothetical protein QJS10_CPB22g00646 [Acorus calamus]|uniref:Uncharacterized protein n=1 Tax=Acorus calamus TaxID=4465 RepID=A0AAV9C0V4_ACOCL|nr:hypothetical protein QJS10_CPB22g00646 [Acorus calamus]
MPMTEGLVAASTNIPLNCSDKWLLSLSCDIITVNVAHNSLIPSLFDLNCRFYFFGSDNVMITIYVKSL